MRRKSSSRSQSRPTGADAPARGRAPAGSAARRPLQERGRQRVEAILDATAAMIADVGTSGLTMQGIASRSGTTVGSMYHFFPDLSCVLVALAERHKRDIAALLEALNTSNISWGTLSTSEAVDRFVDPLLAYMEEHPDLLDVIRHVRSSRATPEQTPLDALRLDLAGRLVAGRRPNMSAAARAARAATMLAIIDGVLRRSTEPATPPRRAMLREMKCALVAYLNADAV